MSETHPPYAPEYRRQMVEPVRTGRTPGELAREFERRAAASARQAQGDARARERTGLEPCQIGRPGIHNHPLSRPPTPDSEKDPLPAAIVHPSAGDDSPQPPTESG